ncbi:MAG: hypothetical protein MI861_13685, partial [Pirellulales bacterium]|nr:hypothetical protein [Pirellulales bacterium]
VLPLPAQYQIESVRMEGTEIRDQLGNRDGQVTWKVPLESMGWKSLQWDVKTEAGLERQSCWAHTRIPHSHINHPGKIWIKASSQDDTIVVHGPDHQGWQSWTILDKQGNVLHHQRPGPTPESAVIFGDSMYLAKNRKEVSRYGIKDPAIRKKLNFGVPVRRFTLQGRQLAATMNHPAKGGPVDVSQVFLLPELKPIGPPVGDPLGASRFMLGDQLVWDGVLWSKGHGVLRSKGPGQQRQLLVDFPKQYDVRPLVRNQSLQFDSMTLHIDEHLPFVSILKDAPGNQDEPISYPIRVRKGVYQLTLEPIDAQWVRPVVSLIPHRQDQQPVRMVLLPKHSQSLVHTPIPLAVSRNRVWVGLRYNMYHFRRDLLESKVREPAVSIEPIQPVFDLSVEEPQTVRYQVSGATKLRLHLSQDLEHSFLTLDSEDGTFEIDLREHLDKLHQAIQRQAYDRTARNAPESLQLDAPEVKSWLTRQQSMYSLVSGKRTDLIPVEIKALLVAEGDPQRLVGLYHSYIALLSPQSMP